MKLKEQLCSLEYANKLKELRIEQISLFYWNEVGKLIKNPLFFSRKKVFPLLYNISAFTASELMDLLPQRIITKEKPPFNSFVVRITKSLIVSNKVNDKETETIFYPDASPIYVINYYCDSTEVTGEDAWLQRGLFEHNIWDKNFCNALAKTLIELYNLKFLTVKSGE